MTWVRLLVMALLTVGPRGAGAFGLGGCAAPRGVPTATRPSSLRRLSRRPMAANTICMATLRLTGEVSDGGGAPIEDLVLDTGTEELRVQNIVVAPYGDGRNFFALKDEGTPASINGDVELWADVKYMLSDGMVSRGRASKIWTRE